MVILIQLILLTSIIILAFKIATSKDMVFEELGEWAEAKVHDGKKIYNLITCPYCMGTLFSFLGFVAAFGIGILHQFEWNILFYYPLCVMGCSIVSGFTWAAYMTMNSKKEYYDNAQKYYYLTNKKLKETNSK